MMHDPSDRLTIEIRYFAMAREIVGRRSEVRTVPAGTTAGALFQQITSEHPRLQAASRSMMLMVNQQYAEAGQVLGDGDEFALIPPVSGGAVDPRFRVTTEPLDPRAVERLVAAEECGAIITFTGTVRNHARQRDVTHLEYEAYVPAAEKLLAQIADEIAERFDVPRTAIHHRTGVLVPGDASVVIAVASAHRDAAYDASRYAIERIKEIVPIWKHEVYADGSAWIGSEADYQREIGRLPE